MVDAVPSLAQQGNSRILTKPCTPGAVGPKAGTITEEGCKICVQCVLFPGSCVASVQL